MKHRIINRMGKNLASGLLALGLLLGLLFVSVPTAEARSMFDVLFGPKEDPNAPKPEKTLQAPFAEQSGSTAAANPATPAASKLMDLYGHDQNTLLANSLDINQPHMNAVQVAEWGGNVVSSALSLRADGWNETLKALRPNFSDYGWQEYTDYLNKIGILSTLQSSQTRMQTITDGVPQVTKEGVVEGKYSWLVQVPVTASFYDLKVQQYSDVAPSSIHNQKLLIQAQITRTDKKNAATEGVEITRWIVSSGQ